MAAGPKPSLKSVHFEAFGKVQGESGGEMNACIHNCRANQNNLTPL